MKLWVDDRRPAPHGWVWAKNLAQAKRQLITGRVERMTLDYDLLPSHETGLQLLEWMHTSGHWPQTRPQPRTGNPEGGIAMRAYLDAHAPAHLKAATPLPRGPHPRPARLSTGGSSRYHPRPRHD